MTPERLKEIEERYLEAEKFYSGENDLGVVVPESVVPLAHRHCGELIQEIKALESVLSLRNDEISGLDGMLKEAQRNIEYWKNAEAEERKSHHLTRLECDEEDLKVQKLKDELIALQNSMKGQIPYSLLADEIFYQIWKKLSIAPMRPGESFKDFEIRVEAECHEITNNTIASLKRKFNNEQGEI